MVNMKTMIDSVVKRMGGPREPVCKDVFEATVAEYLGLADGAAMPGFSSYEGLFRSMQLRDAFIEDQGAILDEDKFEYRQFCFAVLCLFAAARGRHARARERACIDA